MRYGIVSDVHGNLEALIVVVQHLSTLQVDRFAFLGDAVGYGPNPNEVCTRLRELCQVSVMGNHDAAVVGAMPLDHYYAAARASLEYCQKHVDETNLTWLRQLPYTVTEGNVAFCHGSPQFPEQFDYLYRVDQVQQLLEDGMVLPPVTFIGHSHLTVAFEIDGQEVTKMPAGAFDCDPTKQYIITAGSVGQPRDRDPRSCCAVFDTVTGRFEYHRLNYDVQSTRQKISDAGLAGIFGERLTVGM